MAAAPMPTAGHAEGAGMDAPRALVLAVVALFFIGGGLTSLNDVLISKLKDLFSLTSTEAMLTQFAVFMAYFLVSLPAGNLIANMRSAATSYSRLTLAKAFNSLGTTIFPPVACHGAIAAYGLTR